MEMEIDGTIIRFEDGTEIKIHSHAASRMRERRICAEEVAEVFLSFQSKYPDADHPDRFSLIGTTVGNRVIRLVFKESNPLLLITVIDVRGQYNETTH
ncbi:MAG: DUF4258 domain-containing protein [Bacteroidia bacterium]|nr:DUF4258 domain-containing protein [Bacteroidia bacterium]